MESVRFVGLDDHADSIAIAVAEPGRGEPSVLLRGRTDRVRAPARPDGGWHRLQRGGAIARAHEGGRPGEDGSARCVVAIGWELAGFVWAIGRQPQLLEA